MKKQQHTNPDKRMWLARKLVHCHSYLRRSDPVQPKGHLVGQVYSEIMSKTVCQIIYRK